MDAENYQENQVDQSESDTKQDTSRKTQNHLAENRCEALVYRPEAPDSLVLQLDRRGI